MKNSLKCNFWSILSHFWVIFGHFGPFGAKIIYVMVWYGMLWYCMVFVSERFCHFWQFWGIFGHFGPYFVHFEPFWAIWSHLEPYRVPKLTIDPDMNIQIRFINGNIVNYKVQGFMFHGGIHCVSHIRTQDNWVKADDTNITVLNKTSVGVQQGFLITNMLLKKI